jgi:hypothetical protein
MKARILFALFFCSLALDVYFIGWRLDWRMAPAALAGWYLADLMSGVVHMYMDYKPCAPGRGLADLYFYQGSRDTEAYLSLQSRVYARINLFEKIVFDFKKHHPLPDLLGRHGVFHLMKTPVFFITLPLSLELNVLFAVWRAPSWLIVGVLALLVGSSLTQYFHGSLHRDRCAWPVGVLRRAGLLMTPRAHALHHETLVRDFAVINGWSNPVVNALARFLLRTGALHESGLTPT